MRPEELRRTLAELDLSRAEAADRLAVAKSTVRHWINGSRELPTPAAKLLKLWLERSDLRPTAADDAPSAGVLR